MSSRTREGSGRDRDDRVEVVHGWGEESNAIVDLIGEFRGRNPGVTVDEVAETNVSLEVKRRMLKRDPPDTWAAWVGPNLDPYGHVGVLGDATDVWSGSDMERAFHDAAKEAVRFEGAYRGVPLNIQRTDLLYYDVERLDRAGVDPSRIDDLREFVEVLGVVDDAVDADPFLMAFLQPFASQGLYLWECLYHGLHEPSAYRDLVSGNASRRRDEIREALSLFDRLFEFANDDAINLTDRLEEDRFADGEAVFKFQGMWSALGLDDRNADYGTDWNATSIPGTENSILVNMDGLILPANPSHPESTREFLAYAGSRDGIERFNRHKQSIPPRSDVSTDGLSEFVVEQTRAFDRAGEHHPSIAHGFAVRPEILVDLEVPFSRFVAERDVDATTDELVSTLDRAGPEDGS